MADSVDTSVQEQPPKLTVDQFAAKIKAKYPSYANIDNQVLAQKIIAKYPQYADTVEAPKQASAPPLSFLSQPQIQLSPVLPENRDAIQQQQDIANQRISDNLRSQQMVLDPEHREAFSKAANIVKQPEQIVSDKEGAEHYNYMQTPIGKTLGALQYIGSKATKGTAQIAKGASYLADMGVNPLSYATGAGNPQIDKAFNAVDKNTNFGLTKGDQQRMADNPITANLGGLAEFLPAAVGAGSTGGATFYLQGLGQGKDAIDQAEKSGVQVNPLVKNAFILGTGAVNGYLMGDLGNSMFKSLPAGLRGDITASITADAIKKASGKELTGDAFKSLLDDGAKEFTDKLARGGIETLEAYKHAVTNLSALSGANFALKKGVDITNGTPVFNEKLGDLASNLNDVATKQAPFFAIPGAIEGASKLTPYSDYKNTVVESLMKDSSPENVEKVKNDIAQYGQQNGWKPEEIQATVDHTDKIAQIAKTLPKTLPENKVVDAVDLVNNRNGLQEQLNKEQEQRSQLDPAMQEFVSPNEQMLTDKVEQANDKLRDIATGSKTTYSKGTGDEEGQFFKTINGKKEEINESRYNLEKLERTNNQQLNSTDNENESSNGEVRGEQSRQENGQNGSQENDGKGEKGSEENGQEKVVTSGEAPAEPESTGKGENKTAIQEATGSHADTEVPPSLLTSETTSPDTKVQEEGQNEEKIKQKAIDLITHGLIVPEGFKEGDPSPRIDLGMTSAEKRKGVLDISKGKYETAPAKKLLNKVIDFEKNGEYPVIEGLGGASIRHRAIAANELNQYLEDAKANKIGELSQRQIDEFNKSAKELGITAEDIQNYEQYRESTLGRTDNSSTTESPSGVIQQSQNDETTSSPQSSSGETTQGSEPTGVRNADVEKERGKVVPREVITKDEVEKEGKRLVDSGEVDPDALAQDIIDNKKPVTAQEQAALLYHKTKLKNRQRAILKDDNPENTVENQIEYARNEDLLAKNQEATEIAGNVTGRALGFRTETMNEDYSRNSVFRRAKLANNGEDLDKGDKEVLEKHTKKIEELENQLADREEEIRKLQDKDTVSKVKRNSEFEERQAKREITKASLRKEREALVAELHLQARKSLGKLGANKIPLEMLPALTKLARNYVLDGAVSISGVADRIYNDLKDHLEGISKEDISDAIKNGFDDYLDEQNKIRLERSKKRQQTKLKNVREQLETGNYEKRVQKKIAVDNDYLKIRAEINRQQLLINKKIDDIANSQKSIGRKAVDFAVKYGRQSKLASVPVLGKLAATGLTTMGIKGATEGVGKVFSTLLPQITKKSTVEGSVSMQALHEANKYTEGNAVKSIAQAYARAATIGMKDAYDEINIKKGGQSDLSALYGKYTATRLPAEAAELFGHIHSAIKAPIKRFAWEHSYAKRVAKGIENGIDVQDPVIDAKNRLDAYKDAERAIFMGDNFISKGYEASMKTLENANEPYKKNIAAITRILLPFVKVPTNIALSTGRYAFGSLLGAGKLAQIGTSSLAKIAGAEGLAKAIHKGMGELTPEESDMVLRNLKHGSVGGAAVLLGFFHPKNVGGYYQEGEHRKKGEAKAGSIKIFGHQIPMWMTEHPVFQAMQIGATFRRVLDAHRHKDDNVSAAALATASGLVEGIPLANEAKQFTDLMGNQPKKAYRFGSQLIKGEIEPAAIQQLATGTDTKNGAPISFNEDNQQKRVPRKNRGFIKYLKQDLASGIPGLRKTVPKK